MLRKLLDTDIQTLLTIENEAHETPWSKALFLQLIKSGAEGFILEKDQEMLGFILYSVQGSDCHILNIAVHPKHQKQGFGKTLLMEMLYSLQNLAITMVYLEVRASNTKAIHLYESTGFNQVGIRKNYYPTKNGYEDALIYAMHYLQCSPDPSRD